MPAALRGIAAHQPFTPVVETMRGLWRGHPSTAESTEHEAWLAVAYCEVIPAVSVVAATRLFGREVTGR